MGIPQVMGRDFTTLDRDDSPAVAIVNETLVRLHLSDGNPIGKRLNVNIGRIDRGDYEVVGVVGDIKLASLDADIRPTVYLPHTQLAWGIMTLVARTEMDPLLLVRGVGAAVHAVDPEIPLADVRTMDDVVDSTLARPRIIAVLLTAFAAMALALAAVGVYGVMAYSVSQRTQEIGVRMALGATSKSVYELVLGQALRLIGIGVVVGLVFAAALTRLLGTLLYQTEPLDPLTFTVTAFLLGLVAMLASYVPARRGTKITPVHALRADNSVASCLVLRARSSRLRGVEGRNHSLLRDDTIAAIDEIGDSLPIDGSISPQTDPLPSTVRRHEELPSHEQAFDIGRHETKGNRCAPLHLLEGHEDLLAGFEIGMAPRRRLARRGIGETQRSQSVESRRRLFCHPYVFLRDLRGLRDLRDLRGYRSS